VNHQPIKSMTKNNSQHDRQEDSQLAHAQQLGHEPRDAAPKMILLAGGGLLVILAGAMFAMSMLSSWFSLEPGAGATQAYSEGRAGSEVRMQRHRIEEQQQQRESLSRYGWIDRRQNLAQIPIQRAIELIAADPSLLEGSASEAAESAAEPTGDENNE
jgi:hypothetical protein